MRCDVDNMHGTPASAIGTVQTICSSASNVSGITHCTELIFSATHQCTYSESNPVRSVLIFFLSGISLIIVLWRLICDDRLHWMFPNPCLWTLCMSSEFFLQIIFGNPSSQFSLLLFVWCYCLHSF